jgi:hypothetical protein
VVCQNGDSAMSVSGLGLWVCIVVMIYLIPVENWIGTEVCETIKNQRRLKYFIERNNNEKFTAFFPWKKLLTQTFHT